LGEFDSSRKYAVRGVQIWRSGNVQTLAEQYSTPVVDGLVCGAMCEWHFEEIASCHALMYGAISTAKELKDRNALAVALYFAAGLAHLERDPPEVDRLASELIELSTRHHFAHFLAIGSILRGWAR
jgi:hypothetical protein